MAGAFLTACSLVCLAAFAIADINLHNPRGSNNRLNEEQRERKNANRLFNSQNNNRGGHNVGVKSLYYYGGSKLRIEWANQHTCGDENNNCELIIQYMCGDNVRDGTLTNTVPLPKTSCVNQDCDTDERFGLHESYNYYQKCAVRERNGGLFVADQAVGASARHTRQNRAGAKYGYECQEERDYYPYWASSPWRDIVIFTNNPERCPYYQRESQNVKPKFECRMDGYTTGRPNTNKISLFIHERDCVYSEEKVGAVIHRGNWTEVPAHGIPPPECLKSPWSRDNHQGNTIGGEFMSYDWTVPNLDDEKCVIRIRYNISTNDFDSWNIDERENDPRIIWEKFGMTENEARRREYELKQTRRDVDVFNVNRKGKRVRLALPINTDQYGRTFQDRSHVFRILHRPRPLQDTTIHNINVRGKRGNIVQVYPSVEYDFVPTNVKASPGDMVHFQWTGSDTNPANNDGQGTAKTDRSNVVELARRTFPKGLFSLRERNISYATNYPVRSTGVLSNEEVDRLWNFLGLGWQVTEDLAHLERCEGEDPELNERSAYFDLPPRMLKDVGTYFYMSTRNNAFSNRDQKASVTVAEKTYNEDDKGASYRGFASTTTTGRTCQRWDSQSPHNHSFVPEEAPELGLVKNYCRNPNNRDAPWCFTTDASVEWEYCNIPKRNATALAKKTIHAEDIIFPETDYDASFLKKET